MKKINMKIIIVVTAFMFSACGRNNSTPAPVEPPKFVKQELRPEETGDVCIRKALGEILRVKYTFERRGLLILELNNYGLCNQNIECLDLTIGELVATNFHYKHWLDENSKYLDAYNNCHYQDIICKRRTAYQMLQFDFRNENYGSKGYDDLVKAAADCQNKVECMDRVTGDMILRSFDFLHHGDIQYLLHNYLECKK